MLFETAILLALVAVVEVAAFPPILKFATGVVEVTTKGAVPVAKVDVICPEVVKLERVPTEVKEEETTVEFKVVPVRVPALAVTVISALPLKLTPLIFLAVCKVVAVVAFPDTVPLKVVAVKVLVDGLKVKPTDKSIGWLLFVLDDTNTG